MGSENILTILYCLILILVFLALLLLDSVNYKTKGVKHDTTISTFKKDDGIL